MDARARIAGLGTRLDFEERAFAERLSEQVRTAVNAAVSTLRGFASPPGRKVMLLLSGGWPYSPADYTINDPPRPVIGREVPGGDDLLRPLVDTANLLGYTIYAVDVPGVEAQGLDAAEASPAPTGLNVREKEIHRTLEYVAAKTGGRPLINSPRDKACATAEEPAPITGSASARGARATRPPRDESPSSAPGSGPLAPATSTSRATPRSR